MFRWDFYKQNLEKYINKKSSVLVIGGSEDEHNLYKSLGYENFHISNLNLLCLIFYSKLKNYQ